MKVNYNKFIVSLNIILIILSGAILYLNINGGLRRHPARFGHMPGPDMMFDELGLTQEQKDKLQENREASRQRREMLVKAMDQKRKDLAKELSAGQPDMVKVKAFHSELKTIMTQLEDALLEDILQVRNILGQEKFQQFANKMSRGMPGGGRHFPNGPPAFGGDRNDRPMPEFSQPDDRKEIKE